MESIFLQYLKISFIVSMLILLLFLFEPLLRKRYKAKWKYWVWFFLAVWLLVPVNFNVSNAPIHINIPQSFQRKDVIENQINSDTDYIKISAEEMISEDLQLEKLKTENLHTGELQTYYYELYDIEENRKWKDYIISIWVVGIVCFLLYHIIMHSSYRKKILCFGRLCENQEWLELYEKLCLEDNIQSKPMILVSKKAYSPMIIGLICPKLVLPEINYSIVELQYILSHELVHYRRKDLWYKFLLLAANAVHWYNPLVYLMFREASGDLECFCDDEVVREASFIQRRDYTETILNNLTRQKINEKYLSTYFYGGSRRMKNRFQNILNTNQKKSGRAAFILFLCGSLCIGSLIACVPSQEEEVITREEEQNQTEVMSTDLEKQKDLEAQEEALEKLLMQEIEEKHAQINELKKLAEQGELTEENREQLQNMEAMLKEEIEKLQSLQQKTVGAEQAEIEYYDKRFIPYENDFLSFYYPMSWNSTVKQTEDNNSIVFVNQAVSTDETLEGDEIFRICQGESWHVNLDVTAQQYEEMCKETYPDIKVIRMSDTMIDDYDAVEIIFAYTKDGERYYGVEYQTIVGYASFRFSGTCLKENEEDFKNIVAAIVGTVNFKADSQ